MADTYSTYLAIRLPATGAYNNTWGATLNSDAFQLLDTAIAGQSTVITLTGTTYSLPALTGGSASTSRNFCLVFAGTPGAGVTVTVPSSVPARMYLIQNSTGQTLTFTYSGSTSTATVAAGNYQLIWCDGSNCWNVAANAGNSPNLNGVPAANWARASRTAAEIAASTIVENQMTIPTSWTYVTATEAPTTTLDWHNGNSQILTLTGNRVMAAVTNALDGAELDLLVVQDGTGSRTLSWNAVFLFQNGTAPTLGTAPGAIDRFLMRYNAALNKWICGHFQNVSAGSGTTNAITIASNQVDWNLNAVLGTLGAAATINITVAQGVVIEASSTGTPAMDLSGIISGCTVNLINLGYILGRGGRGGQGGGCAYPGSGATYQYATAGQPGGVAIKGPGSGCAFNITNASGHIWGGGGGGGGGGASANQSSTGVANGGGGGAGSGAAFGGLPGLVAEPVVGTAAASAGGDSTSGVNGTYGAGGAAASAGSGAAASAGGAGGDWGASGAAGTTNSTYGYAVPAGGAGAAAKAIELSGGAATFVSGSGSPNVKGVVM